MKSGSSLVFATMVVVAPTLSWAQSNSDRAYKCYSSVSIRTQTPIMNALDSLRGQLPAQKSDVYRDLFSSDSKVGTCGLTCLIDISAAATVVNHMPSASPVNKLQWIRKFMMKRYGKDADVGTSPDEITDIGPKFLKEFTSLDVSARAYRLADLPSVAETFEAHTLLSGLKGHQIAMLQVANHWIVVTSYDPNTKTVGFFDPNLPEISSSRAKFTIAKPGRFEQVRESIFEELYREDYRRYNRGHAESFSNGETVLLGGVVIFDFRDLNASSYAQDAQARRSNQDDRTSRSDQYERNSTDSERMPRSMLGNRTELFYFEPNGRVTNMRNREVGNYSLRGNTLILEVNQRKQVLTKGNGDSWVKENGDIWTLQ